MLAARIQHGGQGSEHRRCLRVCKHLQECCHVGCRFNGGGIGNGRCWCRRFRYMAFAGIEVFFKEPGIVPPVIIKDMRIYLGNHGSLGMPGVTLDSFNIAAVQFQFISDTGMAQAVEYDLRKIMFFDQLCKFLLNH